MFDDKEKALQILQNGIQENVNLSAVVFALVKYYHYLKYSNEQIKNVVSYWLTSQHLSTEQYIKTLNYINEALFYMNKYNPKFREKICIAITLEEVQQINTLKNNCDKQVAFALLYVSKIFANSDGVFICKHKIICKLTGISQRHVNRSFNNILNKNMLIPIQINKFKTCGGNTNNNYGYVYSYPNKYKINIDEGKNIIHYIYDKDSIFIDYVKCFYLCITNYKLKTTRYFKEYLLRNI